MGVPVKVMGSDLGILYFLHWLTWTGIHPNFPKADCYGKVVWWSGWERLEFPHSHTNEIVKSFAPTCCALDQRKAWRLKRGVRTLWSIVFLLFGGRNIVKWHYGDNIGTSEKDLKRRKRKSRLLSYGFGTWAVDESLSYH